MDNNNKPMILSILTFAMYAIVVFELFNFPPTYSCTVKEPLMRDILAIGANSNHLLEFKIIMVIAGFIMVIIIDLQYFKFYTKGENND
ncbi:MAG: hypothetical protein ACOC80_12595 [Petrotogales bacterium]